MNSPTIHSVHFMTVCLCLYFHCSGLPLRWSTGWGVLSVREFVWPIRNKWQLQLTVYWWCQRNMWRWYGQHCDARWVKRLQDSIKIIIIIVVIFGIVVIVVVIVIVTVVVIVVIIIIIDIVIIIDVFFMPIILPIIEVLTRVGSGQTFCQQSRVGSGQRFAGSGPRKVTRGQLWSNFEIVYFIVDLNSAFNVIFELFNSIQKTNFL